MECFTQAVSYDDQHPESLNNLAALYLKHDRYEVAARYYEKLISISKKI